MKTRSLLPFVLVGAAVLAGLFWWLRPAPGAGVPTAPPSATAPPVLPPPSPADAGSPAPAAPETPPATASTSRFEFIIEHGRLMSAPDAMRVMQGKDVVVRVRSDAADELHLHGYDLEAKLRAGETGELSFVAGRSGRFPLELHHAHLELGALEVLPSP